MTMVEPGWLHVTVAQISDALGGSTSEDELRVLKTELRTALRSIDPFTVMVGSCLSYPSGAIFDLSPEPVDPFTITIGSCLSYGSEVAAFVTVSHSG